MLVAAAVCPHPPLLLPGVAAGASHEADDLRAVAGSAVRAVASAAPDLVVVVGAATTTGPLPSAAAGSLAPYGVDVHVGPTGSDATLPLALTVGTWLLDTFAPDRPRLLFGVETTAEPQRCAALGAALVERAPRVALLVMGDGSARRSIKGPGYLDDRAEPFDTGVAAALGAVDVDTLLAVDPLLADQLLAAGRPGWQVLAGAARAGGGSFTGRVRYNAAPYGVCYLVATWLPATS